MTKEEAIRTANEFATKVNLYLSAEIDLSSGQELTFDAVLSLLDSYYGHEYDILVLLYYQFGLSYEILANLLSHSWIRYSIDNSDKAKLLFDEIGKDKLSQYYHTDAFYESLPTTVRLYRGCLCQEEEEGCFAPYWALKREVAEMFAMNKGHYGTKVYYVDVNKTEITAILPNKYEVALYGIHKGHPTLKTLWEYPSKSTILKNRLSTAVDEFSETNGKKAQARTKVEDAIYKVMRYCSQLSNGNSSAYVEKLLLLLPDKAQDYLKNNPAVFEYLFTRLAKEFEANETGWKELRNYCYSRWPAELGRVHGVGHWDRVAIFGQLLYQDGADMDVIRAFAYLHDSERQSNAVDNEHGIRASKLIDTIRDTLLGYLSDMQIEKLKQACELHTIAHKTGDITIDICFDADRIDLFRYGVLVMPKAELMATRQGAEFVKTPSFFKNYYSAVIYDP